MSHKKNKKHTGTHSSTHDTTTLEMSSVLSAPPTVQRFPPKKNEISFSIKHHLVGDVSQSSELPLIFEKLPI